MASITTMVAATLVAMKLSDRISFWGFIIFSFASITWIVIGVLDDKPALTVQNVILTLINAYGIYRYGFAKSEPESEA